MVEMKLLVNGFLNVNSKTLVTFLSLTKSPGKFTFHYHGIPEERGAMGYFNVTNPPINAIDGKDIATAKSTTRLTGRRI